MKKILLAALVVPFLSVTPASAITKEECRKVATNSRELCKCERALTPRTVTTDSKNVCVSLKDIGKGGASDNDSSSVINK